LFESKTGAAVLSVASNATLIILKIVAGIAIGSVSVVSEAIHSSVDLLAAIMALFAVRVSGKPADESHHFGHYKIENVSGTVEALLIFAAAMWIVWEAVHKLINGVHLENPGWGVAVMAFSALANIVVSRQLLKVSKRTGSLALEADAAHLTTDVVTSAGVMAGLAMVMLGNWILERVVPAAGWLLYSSGLIVVAVKQDSASILDPVVAIAVAMLICRAAWNITHKSFVDLLDRSLPADECRIIEATIDTVLASHEEFILSYHNVRSRKAGHQRYVDLHLEVEGTLTVEQAHALCDHLEVEVEKALPNTELVVHLEPLSPSGRSYTLPVS
jgi:divalent metal cation (Fe/Co/Zn/Cd) transporter